MLTFTPQARDAVREFLGPDASSDLAVRITLTDGSPLAPQYGLTLVGIQDREASEIEVQAGDVRVLVEIDSAPRLEGATVDFVDAEEGSGFQIRGLHPVAAHAHPGSIAQRVQRILDEQVNPGIAAHGGAITLASVDGTEVSIEMSGGCQGCALSRMTLRQGVEKMLRQAVPEITEIHDVTDHASGESPYFERSR